MKGVQPTISSFFSVEKRVAENQGDEPTVINGQSTVAAQDPPAAVDKPVESLQTSVEVAAKDLLPANDGLNLEMLRGQGYDGNSNMCGIQKGVKSRILSKYPKALHTHCGAHMLNLVIGDACKLEVIDNMFAVVSDAATFFSSSAKRTQFLDDHLPDDLSGLRTKVLCPTRWFSRLGSVDSFLELMVHIVEVLEIFSAATDSKPAATATSLLRSIEHSDFIVGLYVGSYYMQLLSPLSKMLQLREVDTVMAMSHVSDLSSLLKSNFYCYERTKSSCTVIFVVVGLQNSGRKSTSNLIFCIRRRSLRRKN